MVSRTGHSLAELIVTLTFVAATLGVIAGASAAAVRWSSDAVRWQEGMASAAAVLDSLATAFDPVDGQVDEGGWSVRWTVEPAAAGRVLRVTARGGPAKADSVRVEGFWIAQAPVLPHSAAAQGSAGAAPSPGPAGVHP